MASNFSFPEMTAAEIAEALHSYGIAPRANLRAEDIASPQPNLLSAVLSLFLTNIAGDDLDQQLGFEALGALDNPEYHLGALQVMRLYQRAREFLGSIQFRSFTLRDLLHPDQRRVVLVLSAIINYLHFRQDKLNLLEPIVDEFPNYDERQMELKARIAEYQKTIEDHERKEQMEEPTVQQLEAEVNGLKQKIQEYNRQQKALRGKAKAIDDKKEEILSKISQADFELMKQTQENSKLLSKVVQSPEKLQRALEEKKAARAELKNLEKMAMQNVQEKINILEMYTKASEKLSRHSSKISSLQEQTTAAKTAEKEVKALNAKISDGTVEMKTLGVKTAEWQAKVHETEQRLKAKEKERDERIAYNNRKMATLKSEVEGKLQCLEDREKKVAEKIAKDADLCSQVESAGVAARRKQDEIYAKFVVIFEAANHYMDTIDHSLDQVEEAEKNTSGQSVA
ncbi:kinetochore protein NUF2 homolog [Phragmites australis]|uniref:kinetochore protein NUF2 homolog n=1 Tax=Phragmites australis TaxID=29695 RepID=UPI002D78F086|nr:kinetochore protein NUF2 homolog [Phragmites australis]